MKKGSVLSLVVVALLGVPALAYSQTFPPPPAGPVEDPAETARIRTGPLFLNPTFELRNVGLENNVFNDPVDPKQDWTGTASLGLLAGLRFGPGRLTVSTVTDYVYFAKYGSERSIDGTMRYQLELRTPRLRPWIVYQKRKDHDRVGFEIDERAGRVMPMYEAGVEYRPGLRLSSRIVARQRKLTYHEDERFRGVDLGQTLDAKFREGALQLLYEVSPLSSIRASAEVSQARFSRTPVRDSDDRAVYLGIEGERDALVEGFIDLGWRERLPVDPAAPAFSGFVVRASGAMIFWEQVRVAFGADRDIPWSYDDAYTFYVQQGASSTVTWRPHQRLDFEVSGRHYWLEYGRGLDSGAAQRADKLYSYGGGMGFFIRGYPGTRLGLTVERVARESILVNREYDTVRYFSKVGFSF